MTRAVVRQDRAVGAGLRQDRAVGAGLLLFAVLVCARMPAIVLKGRFWAEEGHDFFNDALVMSPLHALLRPVGGYLNIVATAGTLGAHWLMPLALAPWFTIAVALLFQLCPPFLILTARDPWLQPPAARIGACTLLLLVPASEEVWLQTLHSQFQLILCCAIIASLEPTGGRLARIRAGMLFLAPLCGPGALAILPLLVVRTAIERSRVRLAQSVALAAGAAIQFAFFLHPVSSRLYDLTPATLLSILTVRHLAVPFLGIDYADRLSGSIRVHLAAGHVTPAAIVLPVVVFLPFAIAALAVRRSPAVWLLAGGLLVAAGSYFGAIGHAADLINPRAGERYAYVPQALFGLAALALGLTAGRWVARLSLLIVAWLIAAGAVAYTDPWRMIADGPSWPREIALWRTDHAHPLRLWPAGWTLTLQGPPAS